MSSENSAKRTIISKLSFFQQKDSKKLKTSDTDSVTEPPVTPDTKGKQKANNKNTNHTASSPDNKEPPPEEEVFIKVPKVTRFFATLSNVVLEGDTTSRRIAQIEHLLAQSNGFLGVRYSHYKKSYTLYYNTEYDLRKAAELLQSKFSQATVVIGNSKFDRQAEADRTAVVRDIPLFCNSETIKQYFAKFGDITRFSMTTTGMWQRAYVVYKDASTIYQLKSDVWSLDIIDFSVRVHPLNLSKEDYEDREAYSLKLTGLPFGTTQHDLCHIIEDTNAKSCYIPRHTQSYKNLPIAIFSFDCDDRAHVAYEKNFSLKGRKLYWNFPGIPNCRTCGNPDHMTKKCPSKQQRRSNPYSQLYDKYKPAQYRPRFPSGSRSSQSNSQPTNQGRNNAQNRSRPTSYADSLRPKQSASSTQSSSSSKHSPNLESNTSNHPNHHSQDQDRNTTLNTLLQGFNELKQEIRALREDITHLQREQSKLVHRVHFLETEQPNLDRDLDLSDEMRQYYANADRHASQSSSSLVEIDNYGQATGFLPSDPTSTSFKELVYRNSLLESKLEKMMAIVKSLQSSPTPPSQPSH